ncbi:MAG: MgtC/SapB family protein [Candidatus Nealsonbacteria bacterium]|nr:MgtC/SapB family protein [Candidatus Nealsonbacteria bacterium]
MGEFFANPEIKIFLQILLAALLGGIVGIEREHKGKEAGLRTCILVAVGATLFTTISLSAFNSYIGMSGVSFDPSRIVGQVVLGIGFIGAGLIIHREHRVEGLTTAAGIWTVAAIGAAVGVKLYILAILSTFLIVAILTGLHLIEEKVFKTKS